jgi:NCS1 family nucleobase:cation symporter-1
LNKTNKHLVFHGAQTPIILSDYWIFRKGLLKLPDLYTQNGIYWYSHGYNMRMLFALVVGMIPALPGFFITVIKGPIDHPAVKIFQVRLNYLVIY